MCDVDWVESQMAAFEFEVERGGSVLMDGLVWVSLLLDIG